MCAFSIPISLLQLFAMGVQVGMLESVAPIFDSGLGSTPSNTSQAGEIDKPTSTYGYTAACVMLTGWAEDGYDNLL